MKRRYADREPCPSRPRVNWFILFFIMIAILFFNYFGEKLARKSTRLAPNFYFYDPTTRKLLSVRSLKGRLAVLTFVTLDCDPCRQQLFELEKLKIRGLRKLAVFLDPNETEVLAFAKNFPKTEIFIVPKSELQDVVDSYALKKVPTTIILDETGRIKRKFDRLVPHGELRDVIKVIKRYGV